MSNRTPYEEVKKYIESFGYKLTTSIYVHSHVKLDLICPEGHKIKMSFGDFKRGRRCKPCYIETKRLGFPYVKGFIESHGYSLVDQKYETNNNKLTMLDDDGFYYYMSFNSFQSGRIPEKFIKCNPFTVQNIRLWCKLNNKFVELVSDKYESAHKHLQWKCLNEECHQTFFASWNNVSNGKGCPYCSGRLASDRNNLLLANPALCEEWNYEKNEKRPEDYCPNSNKKVWWKCKECGREWLATINNRNAGNRGCLDCNESKGERKIREILRSNGIPYDSQYTYDDLLGVGGGLLRFDIVVFCDNAKTKVRCLIEYDGIFHYEKQYDTDGFRTLQKHDKIKNQYCKQRNIKLIRIPYWEFNHIEEILMSNLIISEAS